MLQTNRTPKNFLPVKLPDIDNGRYVPLGVLITRVRLWNRWSVNATAKRAGVHAHTLRKIENGERLLTRVPMIMRLADTLEMPREQLFNWVVKDQERRAAATQKGKREQ